MLVSRLCLAVGVVTFPVFCSELFLTVQPIRVCNSAGTSCADPTRELFAPFVNAVWTQANITVTFLPWQTINSDLDYGGRGITDPFLSNPTALTPTSKYVYLYMLPQSQMSVFGCCKLAEGIVGVGLALIGDDVFGDALGDTHPAVIAHEMGHAMGLLEANGLQYVMNDEGAAIPGTINDVSPTGALYQVSPPESTTARVSPLLTAAAIPEPGTMAHSLGFVLLAVARRRRFVSRKSPVANRLRMPVRASGPPGIFRIQGASIPWLRTGHHLGLGGGAPSW
jgi:hypothetical protein